MSHETPPVPLRYGEAVLYPPAVPEPRILPAEIPPGIQYVTLPSGARTLAYTHPTPTEQAPIPAPAAGIPAWAKTTALLAPTLGGGIGAAGIGISYAAPGLIALTEALWATVALIAAGGAALLLGRTRRAPASTHITQHITSTGLFGRARGTIQHR
ncbi:hypothetical protein ACFVYT_38415 [Streptomyces sp. NPDC058290]|uniref:hypothetical protein n=1 Tax=Streptomyces sp. NPDC058290 TaxID=3346426 RepID=UPI0036E3A49D